MNRPPAWAHMTAMHSFIVCNGEGDGGGGEGVGTPKGALSVCVGIIKNILSAFCVKFADFFSLSVA